MQFVDCQGLAGHDTLGAVLAGFDLVHRVSLGRFGDEVVAANRHLLGDGWTQDEGNGASEWEPKETSLVLGTPPCSGFSLMNTTKRGPNTRGTSSAINSCMRELARYAARCTGEDGSRGAPVVIFESVQQAYTTGRSLMQELRAILEANTRQSYSLTHVLMSGSAVGAAQFRHRYFFVAHRVPFGVETPEVKPVATVYDAIGDLRDLENQWEAQPYTHPATWYAAEQNLRDHGGATELVHDHATHGGADEDLLLELLIDDWRPGESSDKVITRYVQRGGQLEGRSARWWDADAEESRMWNGGPKRLDPNRPGYVLNGGSLKQFVHWAEPRLLTARECSRLMGLPDTWVWPGAGRSASKTSAFIGKCCPVQSAEWITRWVRESLLGQPGRDAVEIGEREFLHNSSNVYKTWPVGHETVEYR